ncbi:RNA polymerase II elongation factor ELL2-like [Zeugodacus cucurbitae]|uniref:RNA polymerase II elongation factor ELL2-like n=1 Tax=Zeugodacus cucurbitae TaxID=28588 RepID=UPI0023D9541D|nr:RNA polymerase II elongation factor ELL2-like [Zeugodacus cucurbitae]
MTSNISVNRYSGNKSSSYSNFRQTTQADFANNSKNRPSANEKGNLWKSENTSDVSRRNIRERLTHLLALKPFSKEDLYARLKKEGIRDNELKSVASILMAIALLRCRMYSLRDHMWYYVNVNWPFYTEHERDQVKQNMPQDKTPPHHPTDQVNSQDISPKHHPNDRGSCGSQIPTDIIASPPQETDNLEYEYAPRPKKQRISHMVTKNATITHPKTTNSLHQVKDITRNNNVVHKSNNDESQNPTYTYIDTPPQKTDCSEYEYAPRPKKQRISHMVTKTATIIHPKRTNSLHQVKDITRNNNVVHKSNNDENQNPTYTYIDTPPQKTDCSEYEYAPRPKKHRISHMVTKTATVTHPMMRDSMHQVRDIPRNINIVQKSINDEESQRQQGQHQRDFQKKSEGLIESAKTPERKKQRMLELFGETPVNKISNESRNYSHTAANGNAKLTSRVSEYKNSSKTENNKIGMENSHKKHITDLREKFQSKMDLPKEREKSQTVTVSPATRKRKRMLELFGEDPITPAKRTTSDHKPSHNKNTPTHSNIQTVHHRDLKSDNFTKSATPATRKRQRMIEIFGEDSDLE